MSSPNLQFLRSQDFYLDEGTKGKVMCNNTKGFCLVLFHADSSRCTHCEECIPEFKKLPYKMGGVKFALVNVNRERDVVQMSAVTISPITYVPYIVLYINGRPTFRYDGERTTEKMLEFLNDVMSSLQSKTAFVNNPNVRIESEIPAYSIGIPANVVCDAEKGVCYLKYEDFVKNKIIR
jgi:hypothetical protein